MKIYVVLHNDCIYESAAAPIGYFKSLVSAYRYMREAKLQEYSQKREAALMYDYRAFRQRGRKYLDSQWWGIKKVDVKT
jgi:hypothetical protein